MTRFSGRGGLCPTSRYGPARPDHRSTHTHSHRCGFADGSVSLTMTRFSGRRWPVPESRHGPARPDHRSPHARSHRCAHADGSVEPNHDVVSRRWPPTPRHGPARSDHRSPHTRSHQRAHADGPADPNHDDTRTVQFNPRKNPARVGQRPRGRMTINLAIDHARRFTVSSPEFG